MAVGSILWDTGRGCVSGFGVRLQRQSRVFILKYRENGRSRWHTIGRFGSPWTVEAARTEARRLLGILAGGQPISISQSSTLASPVTIAELCDEYLHSAEAGIVLTRFKRPKKASTLQIDRGRIERHIKPVLGALHLSNLDRKAVRHLMAEIVSGATAVDVKTKPRGRARVTGGPTTAARVVDLLSGIIAYAVEQGYLVSNPVHGVQRYRAQPRERYLTDLELAELGRALKVSAEHPYARVIIRLLVMTGCRLSEISALRWSEVDFQDGCLRFADTKTGRSTRAVGTAVIKILQTMPKVAGSDYVFPASRGSGAYCGTKREVAKIFAAANISDATCHTLRHTFGTIASGLGYSDSTIGGLLGHAGRTVTSRYVHRPDDALKLAADGVSKRIQSLLDGGSELA